MVTEEISNYKIEGGMKFLKGGIDVKIDLDGEEFIYMITKVAFLNLQICTNVSPNDKKHLDLLEERVNADYACGTRNGWTFSTEEDHAPAECEETEGRYHYILNA